MGAGSTLLVPGIALLANRVRGAAGWIRKPGWSKGRADYSARSYVLCQPSNDSDGRARLYDAIVTAPLPLNSHFRWSLGSPKALCRSDSLNETAGRLCLVR